jgi:D-beta-D-heptose 7-phosphate kinase / D-beta-D-heptose 1-phosphate adenosyltransferase
MNMPLVNLVRGFRGLRTLVIGDAMLDTYLEGTATRLCREAPVPVVSRTAEHLVPGGAANTAANLSALDADVTFLSIVGQDSVGASLRSILREQGIDDRWIIEDASMRTLHKLRIVANGQYLVRFDEEVRSPSVESQKQLLENLEEVFPHCDLVVVSDYGYGVLVDTVIDRLRMLCAARPCPLLVDSKYLDRFLNVHATVVTPSQVEAQLLVYGHAVTSPGCPTAEAGIDVQEMESIGQRLLAMLDAEHVAITLAGDGVFLLNRQGLTLHIPTHPVAHPNDVGAGDSFAAAMALALAAGGNIEEAARVALDAASIAVSKRWTAVVRYQELLQRVSLRDHAACSRSFSSIPGSIFASWSPEALSQLLELLDAERARSRTIVFTNGVFDILHAGHVHFLRQAKELGDVLVVGVNSDRCVQRIKGKNRPINSERDRVALLAALEAVDHVVLFDEDTPIELIRLLRPHLHVKGGDYVDEVLPEAEAVREFGGRVVILPLAGSVSTSSVIDRIVALASKSEIGVES